jgi:hypothetical protein
MRGRNDVNVDTQTSETGSQLLKDLRRGQRCSEPQVSARQRTRNIGLRPRIGGVQTEGHYLMPTASRADRLATFMTAATEKHVGKYDYSYVPAQFVIAHTPVSIGCPDRGKFPQTPNASCRIHGPFPQRPDHHTIRVAEYLPRLRKRATAEEAQGSIETPLADEPR